MSAIRSLVTSALFLFAFSGCTVGPDYRRPSPPVGANSPLVSTDPRTETTQEPPNKWWHLYRDPVLDRLQQEALNANFDLKAAEANLSAARAVLDATLGRRYPGTDVEGSGIRGRDAVTDEILEIGGHQPATTWTLGTTFDVSYEVDLFGHVRRSIEASRADAEAVAATRDAVRVAVAAETARAYGRICALGEQIEVTQHSVDVVSREASIVQKRIDAGSGTEFEYVRAAGLVAQVSATLPPLEGERTSALYELSALLGRTPSQAPIEVMDCVKPPTLSTLIPVGDGAMLLSRRPDVRQAERRAAAATARVGVATAELYPRVSLTGFYGGVGAQLSDLTSERGLTWGVGPSIIWTFPNQAIPRAKIRQAGAQADEAVANFDAAILTALKETEQAMTNYSADLRRRQSLNDAQRLAHREFTLAKGQFAAGAASSLDLLTAEQSLVADDGLVASSDVQLLQDQIQVFKSLGGGW